MSDTAYIQTASEATEPMTHMMHMTYVGGQPLEQQRTIEENPAVTMIKKTYHSVREICSICAWSFQRGIDE